MTRILPTKITPNNPSLNSRDSVFIGAFNVRNLFRLGNRPLLMKHFALKIDVCCVSETCIQDPTSLVHLKPLKANPDVSQFSLEVSGVPADTTPELYGIGIALTPRVEYALFDWIQVMCCKVSRFSQGEC